MPLTKEQLLIPRVMCVGGKEGEPNDTSGSWITGTICTLSDTINGTGEPCCVVPQYSMKFFSRFPHLFRPMQWWEGRKPEDMPEYVWYKDKGVFKVDVWDFKYEEAMIFNGDLISTVSIGLLTPATEQEYFDSKPLRKCPDCGSEWKGDDSCPECFPI